MQFSNWNLEAISRGSFVVRSGEKAGATVRQLDSAVAAARGLKGEHLRNFPF